MAGIAEVAREAILGLLDTRDFMSYQLSHANGAMTEAELDKMADKHCRPHPWDPTVLQEHVRVLRELIGDRLDADVASAALQCSFEEARSALAAIKGQSIEGGRVDA